jgi:hypothetical protein
VESLLRSFSEAPRPFRPVKCTLVVGIAVILWVAGTMIWEGLVDRRLGVLRLLDHSR